ncbi:S1C family serine protease [Intrasporangium sp.]|uniref:S1C family serine protease n=1 Tax=Intrasporangium sp. TaxID=1925024 RepID=UPI00293B8295|nr:trypsin-like peptidase domain-containing protein [Intrasporangium sp.]MDV3221421.1 trypsin-like peptidase domain-containing protein [Intrasporangium sp.]
MTDDPTERRPDHPREPRREEVDDTDAIGLSSTQPLGSTDAARRRDAGWFSEFGAEHPTEGPGVPVRADTPWGSDRADALAEEAHRARYAGPVVPAGPSDRSRPASQGDTAGAGAPRASTRVPPPPGGPTPEYAVGIPYSYPGDAAAGHAIPSGTDGSLGPPVTPTRNPRRRRGLAVAGVLALCLASGVVGGVAGQLLEDRVVTRGSTLPQPGPGVTERPAGSVANIAARVLPSVVTIKVDAGANGAGTGSGFVIDDRGHILTNNHVVSGGADGGVIEVVLSNGETEDATIVGRDGSYDLAVLRIERRDLTPLQLGSSDKVVVGDPVIAVGAPLGLEQTVTSGIVSAMNRPVAPGAGDETSFINAIQTDAAINPGNSGGPLLDLDGQVIGVNSAIARVPGSGTSSSGNIGLGFAIPSDQARRTADQLISTGKATHPIIGVLLDRTFSGEGAQVQDSQDAVTPDGPADKAGVQPGDVVIRFEGKPIRTPDQLIVSIRARAVGETVTLTIERDGQEIDLPMTLEAQPDD